MTDFEADLAAMYEENLSTFGREVSFIPKETGVPSILRAVITPGVEPEGTDLGVYLHASAKAADFPRSPEKGDKVQVGNSIYNVVDIDANGAGGLRLQLRFHAEAV